MPIHEFYVKPHGSQWLVDAGGGIRMGYHNRDIAITEAIQAAKAAGRRGGDSAVFLKEPGTPPVAVWSSERPIVSEIVEQAKKSLSGRTTRSGTRSASRVQRDDKAP